MDERCKEQVYSGARWDFGGHRCGKKAVRDGWCNLHHPEAKVKRDEARRAKWAADDKREAEAREQNAVALLRRLGYTVTPPVGAAHP